LLHVCEIADKRHRADLDIFVLALVESGVSTLFEFQKLAGISQGATVPALRRLIASGFVRPQKVASRGRIGHRITVEGRKRLKVDWRELVQQEPSGNLALAFRQRAR